MLLCKQCCFLLPALRTEDLGTALSLGETLYERSPRILRASCHVLPLYYLGDLDVRILYDLPTLLKISLLRLVKMLQRVLIRSVGS
jgi:hypothetical protein